MEEIQPGKFVTLIYDLYQLDDESQETLVHQVDPADPEKIIYGVTQGLIKCLEDALRGHKKGDHFNVEAAPKDAFGEHNPDDVVTLPKDIFEVDGKVDDKVVAIGNYVPMMTADGFRINGKVIDITPDKVEMDFNHPLAGKRVRFKGSILDVRDATEEELHLAKGGTCGGGCGCSGGCGDSNGSCGDGCSDTCGCGCK